MTNKIDTKTLLLIALTASAVILTFIRERSAGSLQTTEMKSAGEALPLKEISSIVDSTLKHMAVPMEKVRRSNISVGDVQGVREEVKIHVPPEFEVLRALTALTDSLRRFNVALASTENLKERTSTVHLSYDKHVFESIVIAKEEQQKGARPSVKKKQKGMPRKARR
jgi:hypothetical protein